MTLQEKLERLKNRTTCYELAMEHPDGRKYLVRYSTSRSRGSLLRCLQHHTIHDQGAGLERLTGSLEITFAKKASAGATIGEWRLRWTGRTQREAYIGGELPWLGDAVA